MSAKSFHKDLLRTLIKSKMRFLSILAIIAIGVGFFAGIKATEPNMILSANRYYQQQQLSDFRLISPLGFRSEDIDLVSSIDGVQFVQPGYMLDLFLFSEAGNRFTVRVFSYDPAAHEQAYYLNQPTLDSGRLPEKPGEIILETGNNVPETIDLGNQVTLQQPDHDQNGNHHLARLDYTIVGRVYSPLYINFERGQTSIGDGSIDFYAYICKSDFAMERFSELYVRTVESPDLIAYSEAYDAHLEPLEQKLVESGRAATAEETNQYRDELNEGIKAWLDNKVMVEQELREAQRALDEAEREIEDGEREIAEQEESYELMFAQQEEKLVQGNHEYNQGLLEYYDGYAKWLEGYNEYQDARDQLTLSRRELDMAKNQLDQAENQLKLADSQLQAARQDLDQMQTSITSLKEIRDTLPEDNDTLTEEEFSDLIMNIRPYSEELADFLSQTLSPEDPGLLRQLRIFIDSTIINLEESYVQGEAEYQAGLREVEAGRRELESQISVYEQGLRQYEAGLNEVEAARMEIEAAKAELDAAKDELDDARRSLDEGEEALTAGKAEFYHEMSLAKEELEQARTELKAARRQFEKEREQAYEKINEAEKEIRESERQILELPDEWFVLTRGQQPGYSDYGDDARRIGAVATVFPLFFFLVAALVCLTTMTRMIEEERVQIGTLKALGYHTFSISSKYIVYALAASLIGSVIGIASGFQIFPRSIMNAYSLLYSVPERLTPFHIDLAVLSVFLAVATTVSVSLLTALSVLKSSPAVLMQPRAPKPGKRILLEYVRPLWKKLSFMQKLTARNLLRYKMRLMMTIIGIAGCTALLLTGFGIKDSVNAIIGVQFDELFVYDGQIMIDPEKDESKQVFEDLLSDQDGIEVFMPVHSETITAQRYGASTSYDATLLVPESTEQISSFYAIRERESNQSLPLTPNGAVITEKLADLLNVKAGDSLIIRDVENRTYTLFVSSLAENYVTHFIYMSPQYFEQLTYREPIYNSAVFNLTDPESFDQTSFQTYLMEHEAVLGSMFTLTLADDFSRSIQSLDYVVVLLIIAAGALAFVVLYNLTSINISERIREIATLKVLGFRDREVSDYVFRENILLTLFGILSGLVLGIFLHRFVMSTMETDAMMFGKDIYWLSFLLSVILTCLFSVIVNIVMFYRLRKIGLVESLKAAE